MILFDALKCRSPKSKLSIFRISDRMITLSWPQPPSSSLNPPMCPAPGSRAALTCPAVTCPPATWWAPATPGTCLISWLAWTGSRHVTRHQRVPFPATARTRAPDTFPMAAPCPLTIFLLQPFLASHSPPWTYLITTTVTRYKFLFLP